MIPPIEKEYPRCLDCHYLLRDLTEPRCPECGRRFDPNDPATVLLQSRGGLGRVLWSEPTRVGNWLAVVAALVLAFVRSGPFGLGILAALGYELVSSTVCAFLGLIWVAKFYRCLKAGFFRKANPVWSTRFWSRRWLTLPVCFMISVSCFLPRPWPLTVRFRLSQTAFEQAVKDQLSGMSVQRRWVGLYFVYFSELRTGISGRKTVIFDTGNFGWENVGFEYDPGPTKPGRRSYHPIARFWYYFMN